MPSINTLVSDLAGGGITGVGAKPPSDSTSGESTLSGTHFMMYLYTDMTATISSGGRLSCAEASGAANGRYLHFRDNHATLAKISVSHPVVVSGNFSGCAFKVYKDGGDIYCAHIARPGGTGSDANVKLADDYARQKGWTEVLHVPSVGSIGKNGCSEVWVVAQMIGTRIDAIRIDVSSQGTIVGKGTVQSANV